METLASDQFQAARLILTLRQNGVTDDALMQVVETIDRGDFVSRRFRELAYKDSVIPLACGHAMLRPVVVAQIIQAARLEPSEGGRVLLVNEGSGYVAALIAERCETVFCLERYQGLAEASRQVLSKQGCRNVKIEVSDAVEGWPEPLDFDRIIVFGALEQPINALLVQLAPDGRFVFPTLKEDMPCVKSISPDHGVEIFQLSQPVLPLIEGVAQVL